MMARSRLAPGMPPDYLRYILQQEQFKEEEGRLESDELRRQKLAERYQSQSQRGQQPRGTFQGMQGGLTARPRLISDFMDPQLAALMAGGRVKAEDIPRYYKEYGRVSGIDPAVIRGQDIEKLKAMLGAQSRGAIVTGETDTERALGEEQLRQAQLARRGAGTEPQGPSPGEVETSRAAQRMAEIDAVTKRQVELQRMKIEAAERAAKAKGEGTIESQIEKAEKGGTPKEEGALTSIMAAPGRALDEAIEAESQRRIQPPTTPPIPGQPTTPIREYETVEGKKGITNIPPGEIQQQDKISQITDYYARAGRQLSQEDLNVLASLSPQELDDILARIGGA